MPLAPSEQRYYIPHVISISRTDCRPLSLRYASDLLQALGHPIRLQIVEVLRSGPCTVGNIVERLGLAQPVVSKHIAKLREVGAVSCAPRGREREYQLAGGHTEALLGVLFGATQEEEAA